MSLPNNYVCEGQMTIFDILNQDSWCGKMSQEHSVQTTEKTSAQCLKKPQKSAIKTPLFLDLRKENGLLAGALWETGGALLGDYMTRSFGEYPNEEKESLLSQILEENPHPKYCLSAKACQGILNRAEKRGKKLPEMLRNALIKQATPSKLGGGREFDSKGKRAGKGALIQTELSGTLSVSQDQTLITSEPSKLGVRKSHHDQKVMCATTEMTPKIDADGVSFSLRSRDYKDLQVVCIGNGQLHDAMSPSINVAKTLNCMDDPMKVVCVGNGQLMQTRLQEKCGTLNCMHDQQAILIAEENTVVRRLTPMECERLQGFPDNWTNIGEWTDSKGKKHKDSDSPRYKALGNSIALPFWEWLAKRMVEQLDTDTPTMASLFDGIGGFPLVFSRQGCEPVWASEIEEFPIAVTKIRFPKEEE